MPPTRWVGDAGVRSSGNSVFEFLQPAHPPVVVGVARGRLVEDVVAVGVLVDLQRDRGVLLAGGVGRGRTHCAPLPSRSWLSRSRSAPARARSARRAPAEHRPGWRQRARTPASARRPRPDPPARCRDGWPGSSIGRRADFSEMSASVDGTHPDPQRHPGLDRGTERIVVAGRDLGRIEADRVGPGLLEQLDRDVGGAAVHHPGPVGDHREHLLEGLPHDGVLDRPGRAVTRRGRHPRVQHGRERRLVELHDQPGVRQPLAAVRPGARRGPRPATRPGRGWRRDRSRSGAPTAARYWPRGSRARRPAP